MRDAAERFLAKRHPRTVARQAGQAGEALWHDIAEQGWPAMLVPEAQGGLGLGMREAVIIAHAAGRHLLSVPLVANMVVLPSLCTDHARLQDELAAIISGELCHAWADNGLDRAEDAWIEGAASLRPIWRLQGADLQKFAPKPGGLGLDATQAIARWCDQEPQFQLTLQHDEVARLIERLRLLRAAELTGAATAALDLAVEYAREREQFGRPIGANQAVKHSLADCWMALDEASLAIEAAADEMDEKSMRTASGRSEDSASAALALDMAQWLAVDGGRRAAQRAVQTHGALGITWECDVHLYLKRVLRLAAILEAQCGQADLLEKVWQQH